MPCAKSSRPESEMRRSGSILSTASRQRIDSILAITAIVRATTQTSMRAMEEKLGVTKISATPFEKSIDGSVTRWSWPIRAYWGIVTAKRLLMRVPTTTAISVPLTTVDHRMAFTRGCSQSSIMAIQTSVISTAPGEIRRELMINIGSLRMLCHCRTPSMPASSRKS